MTSKVNSCVLTTRILRRRSQRSWPERAPHDDARARASPPDARAAARPAARAPAPHAATPGPPAAPHAAPGPAPAPGPAAAQAPHAGEFDNI